MADVRELSWFEKLQYVTTRFIAITVAIIAWVMIGCAAVYLVQQNIKSPTYISQADLSIDATKTAPSDSSSTAANNEQHSYVIPQNLRSFFTGENKKVLDGWLESLDPPQQQDFLDNLSQLVIGYPNGTVPADVINKYKEMKLKKFQASPFDRYERLGQQAAVVMVIVAALFLIVLASLLLLLLGIEKNTRRAQSISPT